MCNNKCLSEHHADWNKTEAKQMRNIQMLTTVVLLKAQLGTASVSSNV